MVTRVWAKIVEIDLHRNLRASYGKSIIIHDLSNRRNFLDRWLPFWSMIGSIMVVDPHQHLTP